MHSNHIPTIMHSHVTFTSGSNILWTRTENREYNGVNGILSSLFQFTDDVGALAISRCASAVPSRTLYMYVLALKFLPKLLSFLR